MQSYSSALAIDPNSPIFLNNRGLAHFELKNHEEAIQDLSRAIELDPKIAQFYHNRGTVYDELAKHEEAILDF